MNRITKILMIVSAVVAALVGVLMMHGCATASKDVGKVVAVAKCAVPTAAQADQVFGIASTNVDQAVAVALISALDFAKCVKQAIVDKQIATLTPSPDAGAVGVASAEYSPTLANLRAWRAANP